MTDKVGRYLNIFEKNIIDIISGVLKQEHISLMSIKALGTYR